MIFDDDTLEQLGYGQERARQLQEEEIIWRREGKLESDRDFQRERRQSAVVRHQEAVYQKRYKETPNGKEARAAARARYLATPEGRAKANAAKNRYWHSAKAKAKRVQKAGASCNT